MYHLQDQGHAIVGAKLFGIAALAISVIALVTLRLTVAVPVGPDKSSLPEKFVLGPTFAVTAFIRTYSDFSP